MDNKSSKRERTQRVRQVTVLSLAVVVLMFAVIVSVAHTTMTPAMNQQGGRDELRVELSTNGFAPAEIQHAPGTFAIAVDNKILEGQYTLRLKAEDGTVLKEFEVQKGSSAWTVNLQTGRYTLIEANHPQWTCRIVVQ